MAPTACCQTLAFHQTSCTCLPTYTPPPSRPTQQEQRPGFDSHCLLGEALLAIQEPEKAVAAFEAALEFYPKDAALAVKCADALVAAHDYHRAVDYYNR